MPKHIIFNSTVTGAGIGFLIVKVQGIRVSIGVMTTVVVEELNDAILNVEFDISAPNGTGYTITYTCTSDTVAKSDPAKASPVTGVVLHFNGKIETLSIPL
jgi:hypothetical protein